MFDQGERRLAQFGELSEGNLRNAETFPFRKRRVCLDVLVERVFFVEIRE